MAVTLNSFAVEDDPEAISSLIGLTATAERRVSKPLLKEIVQSLLAIAGQPSTPPNDDCDDISEHGIYRTGSGTANGPGAGRLILHLEYTAESRAAQIAFSAAATSLLDLRWREKYGSGDWSSWTQILTAGAYGLGEDDAPDAIADIDDTAIAIGFYRTDSGTANMSESGLPGNFGTLVVQRYGAELGHQIWSRNFRTDTYIRYWNTTASPVWSDWVKIWTEGNTTVDGSGFLLEASPIVRVYTDAISEPNEPVGATLTHDETGVYVLSGVPPLASEGWTVRTPEDVNGNKVVAIGEPEYDAATETLTLRTHDLLWHEGRLVPGDPMDIPEGHFVMLRFHEAPEPEEPGA
ncbi:MAG: pyocin knob domain-containing protein [Roseicyclus sp.]